MLKNRLIPNLLALLTIVVFIGFIFLRQVADIRIKAFYEYRSLILTGFLRTILVSAISLVGSLIFGFIFYLLQVSKYKYLVSLTKIIEEIKVLIPKSFINSINDALSSNDDSFIKSTKMLSCSINYALPIIFYLYNKYDSLMDALKENVILGGASSDRAMIITVLYPNSILDENWNKYIRG